MLFLSVWWFLDDTLLTCLMTSTFKTNPNTVIHRGVSKAFCASQPERVHRHQTKILLDQMLSKKSYFLIPSYLKSDTLYIFLSSSSTSVSTFLSIPPNQTWTRIIKVFLIKNELSSLFAVHKINPRHMNIYKTMP